MGYPEYSVGFRVPDDFEKERKIYRDAVESTRELGMWPSNTMYVIELKGPTPRLDMILERLDPEGAIIGETDRAGESAMTLLAFLGPYHPDSNRSTSADSFKALYPHEDGRLTELPLEASWLQSIEILEEPSISGTS